MQSIERLEVPEDFTKLNFQPSEYTDPTGRKLPMYQLTRDGFTLLAMGFTGARAMKFKLAYIEAFNRMEAELTGKALPAPANVPAPAGQKRCSKCKAVKPLSEFNRNLTNPDGYAYYCKRCFADARHNYAERNRERNLAVQTTPAAETLPEAGRKLRKALISAGTDALGICMELVDVHKKIGSIVAQSEEPEIRRRLCMEAHRLSDTTGKFAEHTSGLIRTATAFDIALFGPTPKERPELRLIENTIPKLT